MPFFEIERLLKWRWASCAVLVSAACGFVALAVITIPERIGAESRLASGERGTTVDASLAMRLAPPTPPRAVEALSAVPPAQPPRPPVPAPTLANELARVPEQPPPTEMIEEDSAVAEAGALPKSIPIGPVEPEDD